MNAPYSVIYRTTFVRLPDSHSSRFYNTPFFKKECPTRSTPFSYQDYSGFAEVIVQKRIDAKAEKPRTLKICEIRERSKSSKSASPQNHQNLRNPRNLRVFQNSAKSSARNLRAFQNLQKNSPRNLRVSQTRRKSRRKCAREKHKVETTSDETGSSEVVL